MKRFFFLIFSILLVSSCIQPPEYPDEPVLEFVSISKQSVVAQTTPPSNDRELDSLVIVFSFTDGDGDLDADTTNVFAVDSRTGDAETFSIPAIPNQGVSNGISGEITILIPGLFCLLGSPPRAEVVYSIKVIDEAGHESNVITTPPIELICD